MHSVGREILQLDPGMFELMLDRRDKHRILALSRTRDRNHRAGQTLTPNAARIDRDNRQHHIKL